MKATSASMASRLRREVWVTRTMRDEPGDRENHVFEAAEALEMLEPVPGRQPLEVRIVEPEAVGPDQFHCSSHFATSALLRSCTNSMWANWGSCIAPR